MWVSEQRSQLFSLRLSSELPRFTPLRLSSVGRQMMALTMYNVQCTRTSIRLLYLYRTSKVECYLLAVKPLSDQWVDSSFFPQYITGTRNRNILGSQLMLSRTYHHRSRETTLSDRGENFSPYFPHRAIKISRITFWTVFPLPVDVKYVQNGITRAFHGEFSKRSPNVKAYYKLSSWN